MMNDDDDNQRPGEKPPKEVRKEAKRLDKEQVRKKAESVVYFPPHLISYRNHPAPERTEHILWIIRYFIAHCVVSGIDAFVGSTGQRMKAYDWAAYESRTSSQQLTQEVHDIYQSSNTDDSQKEFQKALQKFEKDFMNLEKSS